jgi:hypothetical protein
MVEGNNEPIKQQSFGIMRGGVRRSYWALVAGLQFYSPKSCTNNKHENFSGHSKRQPYKNEQTRFYKKLQHNDKYERSN